MGLRTALGLKQRRQQLPKPTRLELPADYPWPNVSTVISERDEMLSGTDTAHYLAVGVSAMASITRAISLNNTGHVTSILDMPCGHGRVTRVLRSAYPDADITVSDLDTDAVAFCAQTFNANPQPSQPDFRTLEFGRTFDVIWVGSLITHLPVDAVSAFLAFAVRHLSSKGVAVLSSHGPFVAARIQTSVMQGEQGYGTENGAAREMLAHYFKEGFGYADYPGIDTAVQHYGISIISREWLTTHIKDAGGNVLFYQDHGWDGHHDVVAFRRKS